MTTLNKLKQQIDFITEIDKLKNVLRQTSPIGLTRRENSAEHSWQVILCAIVLAEHANKKMDLLKVVKMLAIHDTVEIDVGDTFHYAKSNDANLFTKECKAADRIFGLLPEEQATEFKNLWLEFEKRETPEAQFAASVDRMIAFIMNKNNNGGTWVEHNISKKMILEKNAHIKIGSENLWRLINEIVNEVGLQDDVNNRAMALP